MPQRYKEQALLSSTRVRPMSALRLVLREGYTRSDLKSDILAGIVVALVALPLGMALAIATGVAPQYGLYTVMIAGFVIALLGGSRCQVSGPTAAFVVILAPIVHQHGLGGLLLAGLMAGIILIVMGLLRLGQLIQYIPSTVTTGFTSGIALVIASIQLKDFFGLRFSTNPESFFARLGLLAESRQTFSMTETALGLSTLMVLIFWPRLNRKIPAPLVALTAVSIGAVVAKKYFPDIDYASIGSRFSTKVGDLVVAGIPQTPPHFEWPWNFGGPSGEPLALNLELIERLLPSALAIAMLGAIESLLSAVVADGMTKTRHDPDAELLALGTGNLLCPFFGGIAATGAIARTATNIRYGAKSPIAAMVHAVLVFLVVLAFAPWVSYVPMASLAALLIFVAYNMAEIKHFTHITRVAPRSDVAVLWICFSLTVLFDMVIGVSVGVVLASLLFMRRMSSLTMGHIRQPDEHSQNVESIPNSILVYQISGPLFFGAARSAIDALSKVDQKIQVVIFEMQAVPTMDVTGLIAFEETLTHLHRRGIRTILSGIQKQPLQLLQRSLNVHGVGDIATTSTLNEAVNLAKTWAPQ